jgi:hypothetical protein
MTATDSDSRPLALRVAKSLRDKGRSSEAVLVLSAWAASGPNDTEGQALLAEALRLEPQSEVAKMAFERMEGVPPGDHAELDKAIARYSIDELGRLDREGRPAFQRAQVGFNNNLKYKGKQYHVQTEDSGLGKPHVITHVFADGGRVIKSHKRDYSDGVKRADVVAYVRALMKGQHMEMVLALREGRFDPIIDGQRVGGMEILTYPPVVEVAKVGGKKPQAASEHPPAAPQPAPDDPVRARLEVVRSAGGGPQRYELRGDTAILGSSGAVSLPGERFCHPREAMFAWENGRLWLDDLDGGNGVFLRIRSRVEVSIGSEFVVGDQLLRLERNPEPNDGPGEGPTYFFSSLKQASAFRVVQIFEGGAQGACALARETVLQIGAAPDYVNELVLRRDPQVAPYHCVIEEQAEVFVLTDLSAGSGVFVRVAGRQALTHGDELLVGRTRLLVDMDVGAH